MDIPHTLNSIKKYADHVLNSQEKGAEANLVWCIKYMFIHMTPKPNEDSIIESDEDEDHTTPVERVQVTAAIQALKELGILS